MSKCVHRRLGPHGLNAFLVVSTFKRHLKGGPNFGTRATMVELVLLSGNSSLLSAKNKVQGAMPKVMGCEPRKFVSPAASREESTQSNEPCLQRNHSTREYSGQVQQPQLDHGHLLKHAKDGCFFCLGILAKDCC